MTYDEIITKLHKGECVATAYALELAVEEEKTALFNAPASKWKRRDNGFSAREAAREFYAEDITRQLGERLEMTPERVISLRRFPMVWAVAEVLITNKLV